MSAENGALIGSAAKIVPMRVDQTRHHDPPAAIDHPRALQWGQLTGYDQPDTIALDQEVKPSAQGFGFPSKSRKFRNTVGGVGLGVPLARRLAEQARMT